MKKLVSLILLLCYILVSGICVAQSPSFQWAVRIGATATSSAGFSIVSDDAGNIYTTGRLSGTIDFDPGAGITNLTSAGATDIFVMKQDASGNLIWAKSMGGPNDDFGRYITVDASGNVYISGPFQNTADFDPDAGTTNLTSSGSYDAFVVKLNSSGALVWAKGFGGTGVDLPWAISVDASGGNVHTTGSFEGTVDFDPDIGTTILTSSGSADIFVSKLDTNGNFVLATKMGGTNSEVAYSIATDPSGNIYTAGSFNGTVDFDPGASAFNLTSAGGPDIFISKLNSVGNFVWAKRIGGIENDVAEEIKIDGAGNIYTTGGFDGTVDFDPGTATFNLTAANTSGFYDIFVSKLDNNGNFIWAKGMGGSGSDYASSMSLDAAGNIYTIGTFSLTSDFDPNAGTFNLTSSDSDAFISKLDASGNFVWAGALVGTASVIPHGININTQAIHVTGFFSGSVDFDPGAGTTSLAAVGGNEVFVQKMLVPTSNFITQWNLATAGSGATQLTFGTATSGTVNYTWQEISPGSASGSGSWSGATLTITGLPAGATIRLEIAPANFQRIIINNGTDRRRLTQVEQWGSVAWTSMQSAFRGCTNLQVTATDVPNLSGITSMAGMFSFCSALNSPANIGSWNTSAVTDMSGMFASANSFNQNIGAWNTSAVTNMSGLFSDAAVFNQDIGTWNTTSVTNMAAMFAGALVFNRNIGAWNTAAVTDMNSMFFSAYDFNQNIGGWNTSSVTNMASMFGYAYDFNQNIGTWNTSSVTDMSRMFEDAFDFNQNIGTWNTAAVTNMNAMFIDAYAFNQNIGAWNTAAVTDMERMFDFATAFNQNISAWNTAAVTDMSGMFADAQDFNQNLGTWTLSAGVDLAGMLNNSGMNCNNYSATLIGWSTNPSTPNGRTLGATGRQYGTNAVVARTNLTTTKGWSITGDTPSGVDCSPVLPTIISFTPASGPIGTTVTITGTNFSTTPASNTVAFNGTTAVVTASTATSITTTVPVGTTTGPITVTVSGNTATSATDFTVTTVANQPPVIEATTTAVPIEGVITLDLEPLITDPDNNLDPSSLYLVNSVSEQGALASLDGSFILTLDYGGVQFFGTDRITIGVCDLLSECAEEALTIEVGGDVNIYNAMSPDGNGLNDIFKIEYIELFADTQNNHVTIYNRWGDVVFDVSNYNNDDRVFRGVSSMGKDLPAGTYFYKIEFQSGFEAKTGFLSLKR